MKQQILKYLGYYTQNITPEMENLIDECIEEVKQYSRFKAVYATYNICHEPLMIKDIDLNLDYPAIHSLLDDCNQCLLIACTLGHALEQRIKYYSKFDQVRMIVLDATGSSYVEKMCDDFEENLHLEKRTFRFCPGYENTPLSINRKIAQVLNIQKNLGIELTESDLMIPQKSMIGIIGLGSNQAKKSCDYCIMKTNCEYRKRGSRCYRID